MNTNKTLASNQSILRSYYSILQNLVLEHKKAKTRNDKRDKCLLIIFLSVTIVEAFINIYFLLLASENKYNKNFKQISNELKKHISLENKINNWPKIFFEKGLNFKDGTGKEFKDLKDLRNKLVHFQSEHNEERLGYYLFKKLLNISEFEQLSEFDAVKCPVIVLDFVSEIFRLAGIKENKIGASIHLWFGDLSRRIL